MMISPEIYIELHKRDSFPQLLQEKNNLIDEIQKLEAILFGDNSESEEWFCHPRPEVRYQLNLEYLAELCKFISRKYNREIVWGKENVSDFYDSE